MATITGTNSANSITGTSSPDLIYAYDGNDTIFGGDGGDYINGGRGSDNLYGEIGDDVFEIGGYGSDMGLSPAGGLNNGFDNFFGGDGYDTIRILPTSGYSWTAIMVNSLSSIEALDNTSGGDGYVFFQGTVNFSSVVSRPTSSRCRARSAMKPISVAAWVRRYSVMPAATRCTAMAAMITSPVTMGMTNSMVDSEMMNCPAVLASTHSGFRSVKAPTSSGTMSMEPTRSVWERQ